MKNVKQHYPLLSVLATTTPQQRIAILKTASSRQINSICEICKNVLAGNVPVNIKKLKKYKRNIRALAAKSTSLNHRRKILINQKGGFLPLILPGVISLIGGIIGKAIGKKI